MSDFLKWLTLCAAFIGMLWIIGGHEERLIALEDSVVSEVSAPPYVRPNHKDLLSGKACIPMAELLRNRAIPQIHTYSRSVACK